MIARFASLSLRLKLLLGLLLSILILVAVALYAAAEYNRAVEPVSGVLVQTLAHERADLINGLINTTSHAINRLAGDAALVSAYDAITVDPDAAASRQTIEESFEHTLKDNPTFKQVRFVSPAGQVLAAVPAASSGDDTNKPYYTALKDHLPVAATENLYVGQITDDLLPTLDFVSIPMTGNKALGYVVVTVDPTSSIASTTPSLYNALKSLQPSSGLIYFYLINSVGKVNGPSIVPVNNPRPESIKLLTTQAFSAPVQYVSPVNGAPSLGFALPIDKTQMVLVAETRLIQIGNSNEVGFFLARLLLVTGVGILLLVLLNMLLDMSITRPVQRLLSFATRISQGHPASAIQAIKQRDEIGSLYQVVTLITGQLQQDIKTLEDRVEARTRDIEATRDIGQIVSSIRELDVLLKQIVELIRQRFENIYHAQVFLVDLAREYAVLHVSTGETGSQLLALGHKLAVGSQSVIGQVTLTGQPQVALDTSTSAIYKSNQLLSDTRAELALPLRAGGVVFGALDLQSKRTDAFSEADIRLFQNIADQLAIAITNARLFEESRARLAEIEALNRQLIGEAWRDYAQGRHNDANTASPEQWSDLQRQAIETGEIVEVIKADSVTFAIPVSLRGQMLGAVEWDLPRSAYNENSRQLGRELAARLAITADNARLFEQAQRLAERERLVNDITSKLSQQADVAQILKVAVQELGQALRLPQTAIRLATSQDIEPR
jgi:GAF domain-containing protein/HAMP domain-containing protein